MKDIGFEIEQIMKNRKCSSTCAFFTLINGGNNVSVLQPKSTWKKDRGLCDKSGKQSNQTRLG